MAGPLLGLAAYVPALVAGAVRLVSPKVLRSALAKKRHVKRVSDSALPKKSEDIVRMQRNPITSEKKLEQAYRSTRKTQAKKQMGGKENYNFGNPGSIKNIKKSGGTVKNYANGGGVRKAKFMDN